jgi:hypothetical protein
VFVLVPKECFILCPAIYNLISCEIRVVICFLDVKSVSTAEIYSELCVAFGRNATSEGAVTQWSSMLKDGRKNIHDEEGSVPRSVVSDG